MVVKADILIAYCTPSTINGVVCDEFTVHAEGTTTGSDTSVIWVDIAEIEGSRAESPEPWGPDTGWTYDLPLHVIADMTPGDYTLTVRAGHVEAGVDVTDDTMIVTLHVGAAPPGVVYSRMVDTAAEPAEIDGKVCTEFTIIAHGETYDEVGAAATIWVDIAEIEGSRAESPEPWGPGVPWEYTAPLHVIADMTPGDYTLTVRTGHVENGNYVTDDSMPVTFTVTAVPGMASLSGKVTGILGRAVGDAKVTLDGMETTTNGAGEFAITNIPLGVYTLRVEHWLYEAYEESLDLSEAKTYTIEVSLSLRKMVLYSAAAGGIGIVGGVAFLAVRPKAPAVIRAPPGYKLVKA